MHDAELPALADALARARRRSPPRTARRSPPTTWAGAGDDLLLVHATGFCAGVWTPIAAAAGARIDEQRSTCAVTGAPGIPDAGHALGRNGRRRAGHDRRPGAGATLRRRPLDGRRLAGARRAGSPRHVPRAVAVRADHLPAGDPRGATAPATRSPRVPDAVVRHFDSPLAAYENFAGKPPLSRPEPRGTVRLRRATASRSSPTARSSCVADPRSRPRPTRWAACTRPSTTSARCTAPSRSCAAPTASPVRRRSPRRSPSALPTGVWRTTPSSGHFGPLQDPAAMAASIEFAVTAAS